MGYCTQTEWIPSFQFKCLNLHNTDILLSSSFMGNRHLDLSGKTHVVFVFLLFFVFLLLDRPEKIFEVKTTIYIKKQDCSGFLVRMSFLLNLPEASVCY